MNIPLSRPDITSVEKQYVLEVLDTPFLSLGPKLGLFEEKIIRFVGSKHCVAVNSGTSALHLAIRSLKIKKKDEVITTPYSFIASSNCIMFEDAKPVFADIDPKSLNIDPNDVLEKISSKTKAILPVHVFGYPLEMKAIMDIAEDHNLAIIEDSCEAIGAKYYNQYVGTFGDFGSFAFYPNKQITTGEGGVLITNNDDLAKSARSMRNQGRSDSDSWLNHEILGYNYRISDINCALGIAQLERIEEILEKRKNVADYYFQKLRSINEFILPLKGDNNHVPSWFVFVIRITQDSGIKKEDIMDFLSKKGVSTGNYFPSIHLQPLYRKKFGYSEGSFKNTEEASNTSFAIPFFTNITNEEQDFVVKTLQEAIIALSK